MKTALSFLLMGSMCFGQVFEKATLISNGPTSNRVNIAILGDGYTSAQQDDFVNLATSSVNYLFSKTPYKEYKNYFNAYAVKVISTESGVKHPGTATDVTEPVIPVSNPNNFLGSSFDIGNVHRCLYSNSTNKVAQVLADNVPYYNITYILGNSPEYGGCGGTYAFVSAHTSANDIALHELGHSFGKLADEYWFAGTGESANKTQNNNASTIKWKNWLDYNSTGIYPYTESPTWFRPHQNCEMRYLNRAFCSVCTEAIIEKIHALVNPVDSFTPSNGSTIIANSDVTFTVNEVLPIPNTLINTWKLNGTALSATGNSITINPSQLAMGNNTLLFSVTDNTALVRVDNHNTLHVSNITWTLSKTLSSIDVHATERRFSIYPNPANAEVFIKGKQDFGRDVKVMLYDVSGKQIPVKAVSKDASTLQLDIHQLTKGTYLMNITENGNLILNQKLIKE